MKAYKVTFTFGYKEDKKSFSLPAFADTAEEAIKDVKDLMFILTQGTNPDNLKANAVIFGADGKGKSLNKIKRK